MKTIDAMSQISQHECWAKTDPETGMPCLSVQDHCLIVGTVAHVLFNRLPKPLQKILPSGSVTLVAAHDVGKLTPGFQLKAPRWLWHSAVKETILPDNLTTNHAIVSQWHLQTQAVFKENRKRQYWMLSTRGHHGSYLKAIKPEITPPNEGGNNSFIALRNELLELLVQRFGPLPLEEAKNKFERIHLLTGFTIFSDWIGSNTDWFPPEISADKGNLTEVTDRILNTLNWNPKVQVGLTFGQQFNSKAPGLFTLRDIQKSLLQAADAPGLYIVEAPMGMGKTEAALTAAYKRWTTGEERGLYFALPTQLTSNKIHDRVTHFLKNTLGKLALRL